jgi:type VI secretion system secreted protein Hcp
MTIDETSMPILGIQFATIHDQHTGQASGKRQHKPILITKEWGANSPQLFGHLYSNDVLDEVDIEFDGSDDWISLVNAQIVNIRSASVGGKMRERIAFSYETVEVGKGASGRAVDTHELERVFYTFHMIDMENKLGKLAASDNWLNP